LFSASDGLQGKGGLAKGSPKGMLKGGGKGSWGKGNQNPGGDPPAPKNDATQLADAITKVRKMRDYCSNLVSSMQDQVQEAKKGKFWSKHAQKDAVDVMEKLNGQINALKKVLSKSGSTVDCMKATILEAAQVCKECKDSCKEWRQIANKSSSVASKGSKKK
jgi:hypothetical protein